MLHFELLTPSLKKVLLWNTNPKLKNKKLRFALLTRWLNFYFYTFVLLTRSWKIKSFTSSYLLQIEKKVLLWDTNSKLKNKRFHFELINHLKNKKFLFDLLHNWIVKLLFFHVRVTNSKLKNRLHFELNSTQLSLYRISSNKCRASNNRRPLTSVAPLYIHIEISVSL